MQQLTVCDSAQRYSPVGVGSEYCQAHNLTGPNLPIGGHCPFILIVAQDPVAKDTPASAELWGEVGQGRNEEASALTKSHLCTRPRPRLLPDLCPLHSTHQLPQIPPSLQPHCPAQPTPLPWTTAVASPWVSQPCLFQDSKVIYLKSDSILPLLKTFHAPLVLESKCVPFSMAF